MIATTVIVIVAVTTATGIVTAATGTVARLEMTAIAIVGFVLVLFYSFAFL